MRRTRVFISGRQAGQGLWTLALSLMLGLQLVSLPVAAQAASPNGPAYLFQQLDDSHTNRSNPNTLGGQAPPLQGTITSIRVTRGRSQIVKFAQPIARMSIAEPTVADVIPLSPDQVMINGKQRGVTSLIVWDEHGQEGIFDLYVQLDTSEVLDAVQAVAPNEKIQVRITDDTFILTGQVSNSVILDEIRQVAAAYGYRDDRFKDLTDTPIPQVMLEVKIAEASRNTLRDLNTGFSVNNFGSGSRTVFGGSRFDTLPPPQTGGGMLPIVIGQLPQMAAPVVGGWTQALGIQNRNSALTTRFNMLESSGKINTLASPSLLCTHGRSASFLAGGEFPFVGSVDQNGSPIIQFKEFGVRLNFTPWISIKSGRIELKVEPEVSNLDTSNCVQGAAGTQVCGLMKRRAETTVELQDGDTLMIAGILSREEQNLFTKVPFIGNVPILGNLFKNADMRKTDRELVVIITPRIVKPTDYGKLLGSNPHP